MLVICLHVSENGFLFSFTSTFCASFAFVFTTLPLLFSHILLHPIYFYLYFPLYFFFTPLDVTFFFLLLTLFIFIIHSSLHSFKPGYLIWYSDLATDSTTKESGFSSWQLQGAAQRPACPRGASTLLASG